MDPTGTSPGAATSQARTASRRDARERRRRERRAAVAGRADSRFSQLPDPVGQPSAVPFPSRSVELARVLDRAAHHVAEKGTSAEPRLLVAMAHLAAGAAPGLAAALSDPGGTEISRLRAFGLLHAHLLEALGPDEQAWLVALLEGPR